jgi:hypothetical protein
LDIFENHGLGAKRRNFWQRETRPSAAKAGGKATGYGTAEAVP